MQVEFEVSLPAVLPNPRGKSDRWYSLYHASMGVIPVLCTFIETGNGVRTRMERGATCANNEQARSKSECIEYKLISVCVSLV